MNKVYVICETHFEYNDETYSPAGAGTPLVFYTDKSVAEVDCVERNLNAIDSELHYYGYDVEEILTDKGLQFLADKLEMEDLESWEWGYEFIEKFKKLAKADKLEFARTGLQNPFFSVYEVEQG